MKPDYESLQSSLDAVRRRLSHSREILKMGKTVDLTDLSKDVQKSYDLLRIELNQPIEQRHERSILILEIGSIITGLDNLKQELTQQHNLKTAGNISNDSEKE